MVLTSRPTYGEGALRHGEPQLQSRLAPSSFTDDEPRDLDVICRIKAPIHAVSELVDKFVFIRTILAINDDGIGAFQSIPDKDVDNFPHRTTPLNKNHRAAMGPSPHHSCEAPNANARIGVSSAGTTFPSQAECCSGAGGWAGRAGTADCASSPPDSNRRAALMPVRVNVTELPSCTMSKPAASATSKARLSWSACCIPARSAVSPIHLHGIGSCCASS